MKTQQGQTCIIFIGVLLALLTAYGWIVNIVKLFYADWLTSPGIVILRVIGIFVAPLGAVLGFF